jgi:nicotinamidase-related amidase
MTVSKFDPGFALIVIDLQKGMLAYPTIAPLSDIAKRAGALADAFRSRGLPVVLVNVAGGAPGRTEQPPRLTAPPAGWTDFLAELNHQPTDHVVTKRSWGAFTRTDLEAWLKARNVTQVALLGVSTSIGVETTAREAYALGFNVVPVIDAVTDKNEDAHANTIARIFPRLGERATAQHIIDHLDGLA